ncbi:hypothetical protein [Pseudomonas sp. RT6P73]
MNKPKVDLIDKTDFEDLNWNNWEKTQKEQPGEIIRRGDNYCAAFALSDVLETALTKSWTLRPDATYQLQFSFQTPDQNNHYSVVVNGRDYQERTVIPTSADWTGLSVTFKTIPIGFPHEYTVVLSIERGTANNLVMLDNLELYDLA